MLKESLDPKHSLKAKMKETMETLNKQQRYEGINRMLRPPLFCWALKQLNSIDDDDARKITLKEKDPDLSSRANLLEQGPEETKPLVQEQSAQDMLHSYAAEMLVTDPTKIRILAITYNLAG